MNIPFRNRSYDLTSDKINNNITICVLADLHGVQIGSHNQILLDSIRNSKPDLILSAGDLCLRKGMESFEIAEKVLLLCREIAPVYAGMGNHETGLANSSKHWSKFRRFEQKMKENDIFLLRNQKKKLDIKGNSLEINGLELPMTYFRRGILPELSARQVEAFLNSGERKNPGKGPEKQMDAALPREQMHIPSYRILLAHNPAYGDAYFATGSDLILSGHNHGGIWRFTEHAGAAAPNVMPFPRYCCGDFYRGNQAMIVSGGLGEHTIPLRIHNPRELITIHLSRG